MLLNLTIAEANCAKSIKATKYCLQVLSEHENWVWIANEPGGTGDLVTSTYPDVNFFWSLHSRNLMIATNMKGWMLWFASEEADVIILKTKALKDTCYVVGTYFNPNLNSAKVKNQMNIIHRRIYPVRTSRIFFAGDMNAKSPLWSPYESDVKGEIILNSLTHFDMTAGFLPDEHNYRVNRFTGEKSWIDTICIDSKTKKLIKEYRFHHLADSDHDLHIIRVGLQATNRLIISRQRVKKFCLEQDWNFLIKDWNGPIDAENRMFVLENMIREGSQYARINFQPRKKKIYIPSCLYKQRRRLQKAIKKSKKRDDRNQHDKFTKDLHENAKVTKFIKKLQKKHMREEEIKKHGIWPTIKRLMGPMIFKRATEIDRFKPEPCIDNSEFMRHFDKMDVLLEPLPLCHEEPVIIENWILMLPDLIRVIKKKRCIYDDNLSCFVLAIFLQEKGENIIKFLGECIARGFTPRNIKRSRIQLIPKADGMKSRPLSVMHPLYRAMDFMIFTLIKKMINLDEQFDHLYGFLPGIGPLDCIIDIWRHLKSLPDLYPVCMISIDLRDAFENISISGIIYGLHKAKINQQLINLILQHITNRWSYVTVNNEKKWKVHNQGTPQGGFLSPLLFTLATAFYNNINCRSFKIFSYADDVCIIAIGQHLKQDRWKLVEHRVNIVIELLNKFGLSINESKTQIMILKRKNGSSMASTNFQIKNSTIKSLTKFSFIGHKFTISMPPGDDSIITILDCLEHSLIKLNRIIQANAASFRCLPLKWAKMVLTAFIRGRINYYGPTELLFCNEKIFKSRMDTCQHIIGKIIKIALDLNRRLCHQLLYYLLFGSSLERIIGKSLFDCYLKIDGRNHLSWFPDIKLPSVENLTISGVPLPEWPNNYIQNQFEMSNEKPRIEYWKSKTDNILWLKIQDIKTNRSELYRYVQEQGSYHAELIDALHMFLRDKMNLVGGETFTIGIDERLIKRIAHHSTWSDFLYLTQSLHLNIKITPISVRSLCPLDIQQNPPLRTPFHSCTYYEILEALDHEKRSDESKNLASIGLHRYAFKQIEWDILDRRDLYFISLLAGNWRHITETNDSCKECGKKFSTVTMLTQPCMHMSIATGNIQLTEMQLYSNFSSLFKLRVLGRQLHKCITFLKCKN